MLAAVRLLIVSAIFWVVAMVPSLLLAGDGSVQPALRERVQQVMRVHCGACHIPNTPTSNSRALKVFDLASDDWTSTITDLQLKSVLNRFESRQGMLKAELSEMVPSHVTPPPRPSATEIGAMREFILDEQLSRGQRIRKPGQ